MIKSPERRSTRKMVKNKNKSKKLIIVKHATSPISITSLKKKKKMNITKKLPIKSFKIGEFN